MCQARVKTTSFKIPHTDLEVWRTTPCNTKTERTVTTDDGDSVIPICSACAKRYITKHKPGTSWLGWFDGSVPKDAPIYDSYWFWWRVYEAWLAEDASTPAKDGVQPVASTPAKDGVQPVAKRKEIQVTREMLVKWIQPVAFSPESKDTIDALTSKLSSLALEQKKASFQLWLETAEGKAAMMKERLAKYRQLVS